MPRLNDKIALVTGASAGIGLATAERFAREGAHVYIVGRRADALEAARERIGGNVTAVAMDATVTADLDALFARIGEEHGRLDVLVANAGTIERVEIDDVTEDHFDRTFALNARSPVLTVQKALPLMGRGSSIILAGSITANMGLPGSGVYSATKAAVRSLARTWTAELAAREIRVNVLSPGPIDTPIIDGQAEYFNKDPQELRAEMAAHVPVGRLGRPEEIAAAALFLASDESSFLFGSEISVDGGMAQV